MNTANTISTTRETFGLLGGIGVVMVVVSLPMWLGLVRRNIFWGARTHTALASDENWRIINRAAGRVGTFWGIGFLALAGVVWLAVPDGLHKAVYNLLVAVPGIGLVAHFGPGHLSRRTAAARTRTGDAVAGRTHGVLGPHPSGGPCGAGCCSG